MKKIIFIAIIVGGIYYFSNMDTNKQLLETPIENAAQEQVLEDVESETEVLVVKEESVEDVKTTVGETELFTVNTEESVITWTGKNPASDQKGTISFSSGSLNEEFQGVLIIDMTSIISESGGLAAHLMSQDFFDTSNFPQAIFTINKLEEGIASGDLELMGLSVALEVPAVVEESMDNTTVSSSFTLDRTLWGVTFGSGSFFDDLGDRIINDLVDIEVELVLEK